MLISEIKKQLDSDKNALRSLHTNALHLSDAWAQLFSRTILEIFRQADVSQCCVIAVGGFGRGEINLFSDLDLNFIYTGPSPGAKVQSLVGALWNAGLEVDHSVRSIKECIEIGRKDFEIRTSLLEASFVAGDRILFEKFSKELWNELHRCDKEDYLHHRYDQLQARREKFGKTERILEPNLKEGKGGLRDWQTAYWCAKTHFELDHNFRPLPLFEQLAVQNFISARWVDEIKPSLDFLFSVRNALHKISGRKYDIISYDLQKKLAEEFSQGSVEKFMRHFYKHARVLSQFSSLVLEKIMSEVEAPARDLHRIPVEGHCYIIESGENRRLYYEGDFRGLLSEQPEYFVRIFITAQKYHATLSDHLLGVLREEIVNYESVSGGSSFLELWKYEGQIGSTLRQLHEIGILERILPEFAFIVAHYKYNVYHYYTTDEHLIVTVEKLESLFSADESTIPGELKTAYDDLTPEEKTDLYWAAFLHDIGKSHGGDHCEIGATISIKLLTEFRYPFSIEAVAFLIRQHLKMEQTAFRRNLKDEETIREFATVIHDRRLLKMLYLLTFADLSAANRNVWTEWKGMLLKELFLKADSILKSDSMQGFDDFDFSKISFLAPLQVTFEDHAGFSDVLVVTTDETYRLSQICGVMSICDASIIEAQAFTRRDGIIIDRFRVVDFSSGKPLGGPQKERLVQLLTEVLINGKSLDQPIEKLKDRWKRRRFNADEKTEIIFEENKTFTLVDVFTSDRIGVLYTITKALSDLSLNIYSAKIGTRLDGVADCFSILERNGEKAHSIYRQEEIRNKLLSVLK